MTDATEDTARLQAPDATQAKNTADLNVHENVTSTPKTSKTNQAQSYLEKVRRLQKMKGFKGLSSVVDCMEKSDPLKETVAWVRSKVTLVQHQHETKPTFKSLNNLPELKTALDHAQQPSSSPKPCQRLTLLIVSNISGVIVEELGSRYKVDPIFFQKQVQGASRVSHTTLVTNMSRRTWFELPIAGEPLLSGMGYRYGDVFSERRINIWIGQDCTIPNRTIGIVLLNDWRTEENGIKGSMLRVTRDSCAVTPDLDSLWMDVADEVDKTPTWYKELIDLTTRYPWFQNYRESDPSDSLSIVCPSLYLICAQWLELLGTVEADVNMSEDTLDYTDSMDSEESRVLTIIRDTKEMRRELQSWRKMVLEVIEVGVITARKLTHDASPSVLEDIELDFQRVLRILDQIDGRIDRLLDRGTAEMQLEAARQSLAESHDLARLSWLATIFIPLTYITGLFSMSEDLGAMKETFKTYFAVAVPVSLLSLIIARWGSYLNRLRLVRAIRRYLRDRLAERQPKKRHNDV